MVADLAVSRQLELPFFETKWLALLLEDRDLVGLWKAAGRHDFCARLVKISVAFWMCVFKTC